MSWRKLALNDAENIIATVRRTTGYTLIDLLVVMSSVLPAFFVRAYFGEQWRTPMLYVLSFAFGIGFWCVLFLWLLPVIERRRRGR